MRLVDRHTGMEIIEPEECFGLLASEEIGRVGVVIGGVPEIFPVNYVLDGQAVVFRTGFGTKLRGLEDGPLVFEVDRLDRGRRAAWSVVLHGRAQVVTGFEEPALRQRLASLVLDPWVPNDKPTVVRVTAESVTGRRIRPRSPASGTGASEHLV